MQMDSGIGRAGYRLLAFMFLVIGGLGLAVAWLAVPAPVDRFVMIGTGLAAVGLVALTGFTFLLTSGPATPRQRKAPKHESEPPAAGSPDVDFEYPAPAQLHNLAERAEVHAPVAAPAPAIARAPAPMPAKTTPLAEMRDRYTQEAPLVREILTGSGQQVMHERVPEVTAKRVPPGAKPGVSPPGTTMGRCGSCSTIIYAPTTRPLRLRCPSCSKVTLLK